MAMKAFKLCHPINLWGEKMEIKICPRCGEPYNWVEKLRRGEQTYYYAVHVVKEGGKAYRRKCYLGPAEYKYVTVTHEPKERMVLSGMLDGNRAIKYMYSLMSYIENNAKNMDPDKLIALARNILSFATKIERIATTQKLLKRQPSEEDE